MNTPNAAEVFSAMNFNPEKSSSVITSLNSFIEELRRNQNAPIIVLECKNYTQKSLENIGDEMYDKSHYKLTLTFGTIEDGLYFDSTAEKNIILPIEGPVCL